MNYDITQQTIAETTLLYKAARCSHAKVAEALAQCLPAVFQHAMQRGITMTGPPMTLYVEWGPGMVTMHGGMPVAAGTSADGDFGVSVLAAGNAAVTVHSGPYDGLQDAHAAIEQYLDEHGLKVGGAMREIYLTDPGEVPNPADWKTQVIWPLAAAE